MSMNEEKREDFVTNSFTLECEFESDSEKSLHDRENGSSSFGAYFNIVCVVAGTGILGLPLALKQGGWIGLLILVLSWTMSVYTAIILIRCLYAGGGKTRLNSYKDVATAAFGVIGGWVTFFFNAWIMLGAPVLYMVLSGANLNQLCRGTVAEIGDIPWTIILSVAIAIPFILLKTMKELAWMSAFGVIAIFIVIVAVLAMAAIDKSNQVNIQHDVVIWDMFPIALSTISFSFGGNVVYPHVEASMKKPRDWPKVVAAGLSTCAAMYFIVAVSGYLVYGRNVLSPVYNSLPENAALIVIIVVITINVLLSAPILTTSFSLDVEEMLNITEERFGKTKEFLLRACLRIVIMTIVAVIACSVPHFGALMSLIGAFANCTLIFIFPVLFYLKLTGFRNKPIYELVWCAFVILLGLVGLIFGTIEAIKELIAAYG
ncbi:MAG: transmembrane amino acid transporter protein-domain-containing protein [Benjaminiella poitrasii]|nr:MAG: transmembrane amino acid transporter protein-domain-containing protein [Benjaminiella poitrasii]